MTHFIKSATVVLAFLWILLLITFCSKAFAHDVWSNGKPIPAWVKSACCGPADAHHLRPDQVHRISDDYYQVDGYGHRIPASQAIPSQDGEYWIFYGDQTLGGVQSRVWCFFVPMDF